MLQSKQTVFLSDFDHFSHRHLLEQATMHIVFRMVLLIVAFTMVVHCQGGGGRGGSRSRSSMSLLE
jgi:hypothetical protein